MSLSKCDKLQLITSNKNIALIIQRQCNKESKEKNTNLQRRSATETRLCWTYIKRNMVVEMHWRSWKETY